MRRRHKTRTQSYGMRFVPVFFHVIQWPNQKEKEKKLVLQLQHPRWWRCVVVRPHGGCPSAHQPRERILFDIIYLYAPCIRARNVFARASEDNRTQPIYDMYAAYIYAVYVCCANALRFLMWHWVIGRRPRTIYGTAIHHGRGASAVKPASARALQMEIYSKSANMRFYIQQIHIYRWCVCSWYGQSAIATAWANVCNVLDIKYILVYRHFIL